MKIVTVELGSRTYPIFIASGLLSQCERLLSQYIKSEKILIITNEIVAPLYLEKLKQCFKKNVCDLLVLPDGEKFKNIESVNLIFDTLLTKNHNRTTTLIALGGGVVGDMTGFAAACYQRGVRFIQIPTTLLSQVDSSVGGKTGINHPLGKNMIGAFHQPACVLIDTDTLNTLPNKEFKSGLAEVVKYGLMADYVFFQWLEANFDAVLEKQTDALECIIKVSCENKAKIVSSDEMEQGHRALLNFGHTFGHAIEAWQQYTGFTHGEAVAVGMAVAAALSFHLGLISKFDYLRVIAILEKVGLPILVPNEMKNTDFLEFMRRDKKNTDHKINLILLSSLGSGILFSDATESEIFSAIDMRR